MKPVNQYVELRNGAYYVAGTRIGLDVVIREFRDGRAPEEIFEAYPSIGSLARLYGAITFILEHPGEIECYLREQDERWEAFKAANPLTPDMLERFERARREQATLSLRFQADADLNPAVGRGFGAGNPQSIFARPPV